MSDQTPEGTTPENETQTEPRLEPTRVDPPPSPDPVTDQVRRDAQLWEQTRTMLNDGAQMEQRVAAARAVLGAANVNPEDIESYVNSLQGNYQEEPPEPRYTQDQDGRGTPTDGWGPSHSQELEELRQRLERAEQESAGQRRAKMEQQLNDQVRTALSSTKGYQQLVEGVPEQKRETVESAVYDDARREVMKQLADARSRFGRLTESDLDNAVRQGVQSAAEKFGRLRAVIGEAHQLGQTPETVAGLERLLKKDAVPYPKPGRGSERELQAANVDVLTKLVAESQLQDRS